jgi:hypothetical protein
LHGRLQWRQIHLSEHGASGRKAAVESGAELIALLACLHAGMAVGWKLVFPITGSAPALISTVIAGLRVTI